VSPNDLVGRWPDGVESPDRFGASAPGEVSFVSSGSRPGTSRIGPKPWFDSSDPV